MNNKIIKITAITLLSTILLNTDMSSVNATMLASEQPIAGINLTLDKFMNTVVEEQQINPADENVANDAARILAGGVETFATQEGQTSTVEQTGRAYV